MKTFVLGLVVVAGIMSSCSPKAKEETTLSGLNPKKFRWPYRVCFGSG